MPRVLGAIAFAVALFCAAVAARADIVVTVDKTAQRLSVDVDGARRYDWPVSTARWGYRTPNGSYRPERLERKWFSRKYDWSPMPWSIFFNEGYAIHGSYEISRLGRPASQRLHPPAPEQCENPVRTGQGACPRHADCCYRRRGASGAARGGRFGAQALGARRRGDDLPQHLRAP
jgi:hypothetical protein